MRKIVLYIIVSFPLGLFAQFDGVVGTTGCKAIHCDDARIIEWALNCQVFRGFKDIAIPSKGVVNYGQDNDALGKVEDANTLKAVSLGDSGVAIITFQTPIANGDGADFVVFENSFDDKFLELAFVEVSSDGIHYFRFPAVSNTQTAQQVNGGQVAIDAAQINNLAGKYRVGWGTPFDLDDLDEDADLDKNNIQYVKLIDVIGTIDPQYASHDKNGNIVNDPYPTSTEYQGVASGGFDLTGVGVINNQNNVSVSEYDGFFVSVYPNPCLSFIYIHAKGCELSLYNILGQKLLQQQLTENTSQIAMSNYPSGVYFLHLQNDYTKKCVKIVKR